MTKIYLIRHAESIANTKGIYQGQSYDSDLSVLGVKQAEALGRRLASIPLDTIYSSPLKRAVRTAEAIQRHHVQTVPMTQVHDIIETNHGKWEGKHKADVEKTWPELYRLWLTTPSSVQFPSGEHFRDTARRVTQWFDQVVRTDKVVAVVTHINVIQILMSHIHGTSLDDLWKFSVGPTAITLVESHSPARITVHNDTSHLVDLTSDLSKQAL